MKNLRWTNAESHCITLGGHLASVHSDKEKDFILGLSSTKQFWIGGNDEETEGEWVWTDGSDFSYSFSNRWQPYNYRNKEDCLFFLTNTTSGVMEAVTGPGI